jgi:hypothetical protein
MPETKNNKQAHLIAKIMNTKIATHKIQSANTATLSLKPLRTKTSTTGIGFGVGK